jgi:hypothetical protein
MGLILIGSLSNGTSGTKEHIWASQVQFDLPAREAQVLQVADVPALKSNIQHVASRANQDDGVEQRTMSFSFQLLLTLN